MAGKTILLTDRDRRIIAEVSRFGAMTRDQLQSFQLFSSATRAKTRLKQLVEADFLGVRRQPLLAGGPRCVYLPARGAGGEGTRLQNRSTLFLMHQLGLVDIRIGVEQAATAVLWRSDRELALLKLEVIPDAYVEGTIGSVAISAFVEYDRGTEPLGRFERKVKSYLDLAFSGKFARIFNRKYFRVLIVTDAVGRREELNQAVAKVTDRVFRFAMLSDIKVHGMNAPIWRRPGLNVPEPLTHS